MKFKKHLCEQHGSEESKSFYTDKFWNITRQALKIWKKICISHFANLKNMHCNIVDIKLDANVL
jgi:hypothetical protein